MKVLSFSIPDKWIPKDKKWHSIQIEYKRSNPFVVFKIDDKKGDICYFEERDVK